MDAARRVVRTVRNNWKKSLFGSLMLYWGGSYANNKHKEILYMREKCLEARQYGEAPLPVSAQPRHITVILNPTAKNGKARALFDKYCGPLLNLAGLKVGIVKTEAEGQAKQLMEIMDNTDAVLVAGGDGTLAEVVTGLLRRSDAGEAVRRFPVAVIPLGRTNSLAAQLFGHSADAARQIAEATMAVIRQATRPLDVIQLQAIETEAEVPGRPVYLVSGISWGAFRDVTARLNTYWYWGPLKGRAAYLLNALRDLNWSCNADMEYVEFCAGCSRCHQQKLQQKQQPNDTQRWWRRLVPKTRTTPPAGVQDDVDLSTVDNPQCGVWHSRPVSTVDWQLSTASVHQQQSPPSQRQGLTVRIGPESVTTTEFVSEGWRRVAGRSSDPPYSSLDRETVINVSELKLIPRPEDRSVVPGPISAAEDPSEKNTENLTSDTNKNNTKNSKTPPSNTRWFTCDSEDFEVRPISVKLLPRAINVFVPSTEQDSRTQSSPDQQLSAPQQLTAAHQLTTPKQLTSVS